MQQTLHRIPGELYSAQATRQIDANAIEQCGIPGYSLMSRAGNAVFDLIQQHYTLAKRLLVCCGAGNNAGDGYVVARLATQAGMDVSVISMIDPTQLKGDALQAYGDWKSLGRQLSRFKPEMLDQHDLVIDALLGTGLQRPVSGEWAELIEHINGHPIPVIAVDVPSGLNADTGSVMGTAIRARMTLSFIAMKQGLLTNDAADTCGDLYFAALEVPEEAYRTVLPSARLLGWEDLSGAIQPRPRNSHKGDFGRLLLVGGDHGMPGAIRMAAEAALRCGCGMVSVATRKDHVGALLAGRPELMIWDAEDGIPEHLLLQADAVVIGPGLGRGDWGRHLLQQVLTSRLPKLVDADGLNLLTKQQPPRQDWILTPHPGEAARLLDESGELVQQDRFSAARRLQNRYGGSVVLKGCGTIVQSSEQLPGVCAYGNPGMASAGMGDVLAGIIGSLLAQGHGFQQAAELGVVVHARAGDLAARDGERGMLASDLFDTVRRLMNTPTTDREQGHDD